MVSEIAAIEITMLHEDGYSINELAKKFHCSRATIKKILKEGEA